MYCNFFEDKNDDSYLYCSFKLLAQCRSVEQAHWINDKEMKGEQVVICPPVFPGVNPYPGIPADANFYKLIQSGFKMDQPFYATEEM